MAAERKVKVENTLGLHFRPASRLVQMATRFQSDIILVKEEKRVNAKSMMEVLLLAAEQGTELTIRADGPDEEAAVRDISGLFSRKFEEE